MGRYRYLLEKNTNQNVDAIRYRVSDGGEKETLEYKDVLHLSQVVDTALLKTYLLTSSPLLKSLVRVDNFCQEKEAEEMLRSFKV